MPFQPPPRPASVLATVLAAAGLMLSVASCAGHITPLGPDSAATMPPARHLGSPIRIQVMRNRPPTATGGCPAGWVTLSQPPRALAVPCFRPVGTPVTITSAAVSSVFANRPPAGQPKAPTSYGFMVSVPAADVAAVTAIVRQAYDSGRALGVSVAGELWQAPHVAEPFSGQQFEISVLSRNQALRLHRLLVPSG